MRVHIRFACVLVGCVAIPALTALLASSQTVVATKQVQMKTKTFLFKFPVEAQRGERWEVTNKGKNTVSLTFGPNDERREMMRSAGIKKTFEYVVDAGVFNSSFVTEADWPGARRALAAPLQKQFTDLSLEQCEKIIEGELWIGMKKEHAAEAVGDRILRKESRETVEGKSESWRVGAFSLGTTAKSTATSYVLDETIFASPSRPHEPLEVRGNRDLDTNTRLLLTFKNDLLIEIVRR
jgi:hypothetical protein